MENLFTEEPVRSLREYFDVFMINAVSENNDFGVGYKTAFSCKLAGKIAQLSPVMTLLCKCMWER